MSKTISITTTTDLHDVEVEVEVELSEVLDYVSIGQCLDHFADADETWEWLNATELDSTIAGFVLEDDELTGEILDTIAGWHDEDDRRSAIERLGGTLGGPKLTDGDLVLIATALGSIAAECEHIAARAPEGNVREAFQQSAAAYRALREKVES